MQSDHEVDEQGRRVFVTPGRASRRQIGRNPEELMEMLRNRQLVDMERWTQFYCALLGGVRSEEDMDRAMQLADYAYATTWARENPKGLAG